MHATSHKNMWNRGTPEEEAARGELPYLDVLRRIHRDLAPELYLEIGVRTGRSLALARGPAIGVDPFPAITVELRATASVVAMTSDDFFASTADDLLTRPPDLVFIDGMHLFEYVLRDFMNVERRATPTTLVVIDDVLPAHPAQAERGRRTNAWTGDVWKIYRCLQRYRPDLYMRLVDSLPTGLLLVAGLDPTDRTLRTEYEALVRDYAEDESAPPESILARVGAISPSSRILGELLATLRGARGTSASPSDVVADLRSSRPDPGAALAEHDQ